MGLVGEEGPAGVSDLDGELEGPHVQRSQGSLGVVPEPVGGGKELALLVEDMNGSIPLGVAVLIGSSNVLEVLRVHENLLLPGELELVVGFGFEAIELRMSAKVVHDLVGNSDPRLLGLLGHLGHHWELALGGRPLGVVPGEITTLVGVNRVEGLPKGFCATFFPRSFGHDWEARLGRLGSVGSGARLARLYRVSSRRARVRVTPVGPGLGLAPPG